MTTVWSYGSIDHPDTFNYPAFTIEAEWNKDTQVQWRNELVDAMGNPLPHLLPVDPTLHWANPIGMRDMAPSHDPADPYWTHPYVQGPNGSYTGPVPMITHVHGAHTFEDSDGYPEAWYLPAQAAMDPNIAWATGTYFDIFSTAYGHNWGPGTATFKYPNTQRATTLWYHDHTLGMTRVNVYAGPAGFYLIRGGPDDMVLDGTGQTAVLPGPAPGVGDDPFGTYYEIPIVIQDRSFDADGSLFYPDNRAFFEGLNVPPTMPYLDIPFIPDLACGGQPNDVSPIWQPEFFGDAMVVNGRTWPYLEVEARRYRFRFLNGCNSRFLILKMNGLPFYQIGADGGFLSAPVVLSELLMGPAERADVIVDFTGLENTEIILLNDGPDAPFGGLPVDEDDLTMPQMREVMRFQVKEATGEDPSTPPMDFVLPTVTPPDPPGGPYTNPRQVSLNEEMSQTVFVTTDANGNVVLDCTSPDAFGPTAALLGTYASGNPTPLRWMDPVSENPLVGSTEIWEIYNFTADAHPIHIHLVQFQVVDRQALAPVDLDGVAIPPASPTGTARGPEAWETGFKDTLIVYPGEVARVQARFDIAGRYVWHCHIVEHEDNEMMRPYDVV
jgi:FtsP/CotA-like multicopper oxidase with cupredoxin domain